MALTVFWDPRGARGGRPDLSGDRRGARPAKVRRTRRARVCRRDHRLHYRCDGAGSPTVILEAGIAASSLTWSRVQPVIARETRVCSYDRAGLAWSEGASSARSIDCAGQRAARPAHPRGRSASLCARRAFVWRAHHPCVRTRASGRRGRTGVRRSAPSRRMVRSIAKSAAHASRRHLSVAPGRFARAARRGATVCWPCSAAALQQRLDSSAGCSAAKSLRCWITWSARCRSCHRKFCRSCRRTGRTRKRFAACGSISRRCLRALRISREELMRSANIPVVVLSAGARDPRWLAADAALAQRSSSGRHIVSPRSGHWIHLDDPDLVISAIHDVIESRKGNL